MLEGLGWPRPVAAHLEIAADLGGAPRARVAAEAPAAIAGCPPGTALPVALSIAHSGGQAFCVAEPGFGPLGVDLERVEPRDPAFVETFFTAAEQARVAAAAGARRDLLVTLTWCAKEAALKVLQEGLRLDTRTVECGGPDGADPATWAPLPVRVDLPEAPDLAAWWRAVGGFVLVVAAPPGPLRRMLPP